MENLNRKALITYLLIAFGLAWILFLLPLAFGDPGSEGRTTASLFTWSAAMWMPGIAALITTRLVEKKGLKSLGLIHFGEGRAYLWAWLLPIALVVVTGLLTAVLKLGVFDPEFTAIKEALAQTPGGQSVAALPIVAMQIAVALTIAPLINTLFALGEELGWRGYLLPHLLPLGQWRAILLSGAIWGLWHAPAILQGHNYPNHPVLGVFLMIVFCVLAGAILSWLFLRTRSPWAPALAHGSINAVAGLPMIFLTGVDITLGGTLASVTGWIPMVFFVAWLAWSRRLPAPENTGTRITEGEIHEQAQVINVP